MTRHHHRRTNARSDADEASDGSGAHGRDLETTMAERVVQVLTPIVGADHVKSSVTIEYDPTSGDSTQDVYDPTASAVLTSQISHETADGLEPSGIPGTATQCAQQPAAGAAANQTNTDQSTQGISTESKTFAVSHTVRHLIEPAGRIKRVAAAILVDDLVDAKDASGKASETHRKRTPEEMKQIEDLAKAALGLDSTRGDQISVQNVSFRAPDAETFTPTSLPERVRVIAEQWTGLLRYVAILGLFLLVYFLILNPVKTRVLTAIEAAGAHVPAETNRALGAETAAGSPELYGGGQVALAGAGGERAAIATSTSNCAEATNSDTSEDRSGKRVAADPGWLRDGAQS